MLLDVLCATGRESRNPTPDVVNACFRLLYRLGYKNKAVQMVRLLISFAIFQCDLFKLILQEIFLRLDTVLLSRMGNVNMVGWGNYFGLLVSVTMADSIDLRLEAPDPFLRGLVELMCVECRRSIVALPIDIADAILCVIKVL